MRAQFRIHLEASWLLRMLAGRGAEQISDSPADALGEEAEVPGKAVDADASIRVLVADDQPLVRGGIAKLLGVHPDILVVGEAGSGEEAVTSARSLRPDVILMDLRMPGGDGIEATATLTQDPVHDQDRLMKVLVLTTFNDETSVYGALQAGASGFLLKDNAPAHLVEAVRAVAGGDSWIDSTVASQVLRALAATPHVVPPTSVLNRLTPREREVLILMASGLSNSDISGHLVLSEATVRTHVSRILMKTGARDRTQAVVVAYQGGLIRVSPL